VRRVGKGVKTLACKKCGARSPSVAGRVHSYYDGQAHFYAVVCLPCFADLVFDCWSKADRELWFPDYERKGMLTDE
jgi:hypothetical protein